MAESESELRIKVTNPSDGTGPWELAGEMLDAPPGGVELHLHNSARFLKLASSPPAEKGARGTCPASWAITG